MGRVKAWWMDQQDQAFEEFEIGLINEDQLKQKLIDLNAFNAEEFDDYLWMFYNEVRS